MKRELNWLEPQNAQAGFPEDGLYAGSLNGLASDPKHRQVPLDHAFLMEQEDDDRRLSVAGAFIMFMFGFGCGVFWTILLTWFF